MLPRFDKNKAFNKICCQDCKDYMYYPAKLHPTDNAAPEEHVCRNGDFGQEYPCNELLGAVERLIEDGDCYCVDGYLATADVCAIGYLEFDADWDSYKYWYIPNSEGSPQGYDTLGQVWEEFFQ